MQYEILSERTHDDLEALLVHKTFATYGKGLARTSNLSLADLVKKQKSNWRREAIVSQFIFLHLSSKVSSALLPHQPLPD